MDSPLFVFVPRLGKWGKGLLGRGWVAGCQSGLLWKCGRRGCGLWKGDVALSMALAMARTMALLPPPPFHAGRQAPGGGGGGIPFPAFPFASSPLLRRRSPTTVSSAAPLPPFPFLYLGRGDQFVLLLYNYYNETLLFQKKVH